MTGWRGRRRRVSRTKTKKPEGKSTDKMGKMESESCFAKARGAAASQQSAAVPTGERVRDEWYRNRRAGGRGELRRKVLSNPFKRKPQTQSFLRGFSLQLLRVMLSPRLLLLSRLGADWLLAWWCAPPLVCDINCRIGKKYRHGIVSAPPGRFWPSPRRAFPPGCTVRSKSAVPLTAAAIMRIPRCLPPLGLVSTVRHPLPPPLRSHFAVLQLCVG